METKPALQSKTIKNALMAALTAVGTAVAATYSANEPAMISFITALLPSYLAGFAQWAIPAIGAALTAYFTKGTIQGRKEATKPISGIF